MARQQTEASPDSQRATLLGALALIAGVLALVIGPLIGLAVALLGLSAGLMSRRFLRRSAAATGTALSLLGTIVSGAATLYWGLILLVPAVSHALAMLRT